MELDRYHNAVDDLSVLMPRAQAVHRHKKETLTGVPAYPQLKIIYDEALKKQEEFDASVIWHKIIPTVGSQVFKPRYHHTTVLHPDTDCLLVYGGIQSMLGLFEPGYDQVECFEFSSSQWTKRYQPCHGSNKPSGCQGHTAVVYRRCMWLFGGENNDKFSDTGTEVATDKKAPKEC